MINESLGIEPRAPGNDGVLTSGVTAQARVQCPVTARHGRKGESFHSLSCYTVGQ